MRRRGEESGGSGEETESSSDTQDDANTPTAAAADKQQQQQSKRSRVKGETEEQPAVKRPRAAERLKNEPLEDEQQQQQQQQVKVKRERRAAAAAAGGCSESAAVGAPLSPPAKRKKRLPTKPEHQHQQDDYLDADNQEGVGCIGSGLGVFKPLPLCRLIRARLREYQEEGVDWLFRLHRAGANCILADEMGLGKTIQTIALLAKMALELGVWGPHLVVVPTSVLENWETEFRKFLPGFRVLLYYGSAAERQKKRQGWMKRHAFNVCIVSYATAVKDAAILRRREWYSLVLDEAQNIKNFNSKRWQTLLTFNSKHRLLLTGTPLQNHLLELWSLMHFLMPTLFSSHENFKEWFDNPLTAAIEQSRVQRHQKLVRKLHQVLRPYILRRLKKDVERQMPSKFEHVVKCFLTRRQRCLYDEFLGSGAVKGTLQQQQYRGMMNALMQLRKVCNHPDLFEPRQTQTPVGLQGLASIEATIPAVVCLWPQEPWCLNREHAIQSVTHHAHAAARAAAAVCGGLVLLLDAAEAAIACCW